MSIILKTGGGKNFCISTIYRVNTLEAENLSEITKHLEKLVESKKLHKHIIIGDLNLNEVSWPDGNTTCELQRNFVNLFHNNGFKQIITEPLFRQNFGFITNKLSNIYQKRQCSGET